MYNPRLYTADCQGNGNLRLQIQIRLYLKVVRIQLAGRIGPRVNGLLKASLGSGTVRCDGLAEQE